MQTGFPSFWLFACLACLAHQAIAQEIDWGNRVGHFRIGMRFEKTDFVPGQPIVATLVIENASEETQTLAESRPTGGAYHIVMTRDGFPLRRDLSWIRSQIHVHIGPKAFYTNTVHLDSQFDMSVPGTYSVSAMRLITPEPKTKSNSISDKLQHFAASLLPAKSNSAANVNRPLIQSGTAFIQVSEGRTQADAPQVALVKGDVPQGAENSPNLPKADDAITSPPIPTAETPIAAADFDYTRRIGIGIIIGIAVLLLVIFARAKAPFRRSRR
jgi:hypothetical protein